MEDLLKVGVITTTHGLRGEVKVYPTTDTPRRFLELSYVLVDTGSLMRRLTIDTVRFYKNLAILKFAECSQIEDVEPYKGCALWIPRTEGQPLADNEYYIADLVGMDVILEDGSFFGILRDVMETGANDVYVVDSREHGEVLLPAIGDCILSVDVEQHQMMIHLMKGLL